MNFETLDKLKAYLTEEYGDDHGGLAVKDPEGVQQQYDAAETYPATIHYMVTEYRHSEEGTRIILAIHKEKFDKNGDRADD